MFSKLEFYNKKRNQKIYTGIVRNICNLNLDSNLKN